MAIDIDEDTVSTGNQRKGSNNNSNYRMNWVIWSLYTTLSKLWI